MTYGTATASGGLVARSTPDDDMDKWHLPPRPVVVRAGVASGQGDVPPRT